MRKIALDRLILSMPRTSDPGAIAIRLSGFSSKQVAEGMAATFSGKSETMQATSEAELAKLHAEIGQLVIEKVFLSKAFGR